jgi:CheY-like chemotaxis protein
MQERMATILAVDDERVVLGLCQRILEFGGHDVLTASSGDEALRRVDLHSSPIDLALLDVMMPGMNGIVLAGHLQQKFPDLPILLMSGYSVHEVSRLTHGKEFRIIFKPFTSESLLQMIRNTMGEDGQ